MSSGLLRAETCSSAETVPQHGLHKTSNNERPAYSLLDGGSSTYEPKVLKKLEKSAHRGKSEPSKDHSVPREGPACLQEAALNTSKGSYHHFSAFGSSTRRSQLLGHAGAGSRGLTIHQCLFSCTFRMLAEQHNILINILSGFGLFVVFWFFLESAYS